ncbi:hypothetical protein IVA80_01725 [Bradyrhizobium sp. 139]|uniref:hypothetical protein n=1 Tax=Bradyrhizobium sp. 139 TaxID=2782616 RepID=UPI001FF9EE12|nr:hypothetical protein [Bradyrhizobium sp. 139]MCK1739620.1 hypothetical protein [Bradyrhizobium sp. 139]
MRLARSLWAKLGEINAQYAQNTLNIRAKPRTNICKDLHGSDEAVPALQAGLPMYKRCAFAWFQSGD